MFWLAFRELISRRTANTLAALGLLIATLGFLNLASTAQLTQATLNGSIGQAWNTPYDLLIRPKGAVTDLEKREGLIRPNYVSGINGGITRAQLATIRQITGVQVAAPIAVVGFVNWEVADFDVDLSHLPRTGPLTVYRVITTSNSQARLSNYPVETHYVVVATEGVVFTDPHTIHHELHVSNQTINCNFPVDCWAPTMCFGEHCSPADHQPLYGFPTLQPIVIAGVDPQAKAELFGLDHCITSGHNLISTDRPYFKPDSAYPDFPHIPVLLSTHSFVDEIYTAQITLANSSDPVLRGTSPSAVTGWHPLGQSRITADDLYRSYLPRVGEDPDEWPIWTTGDVTYKELGPDHLQAIPQVAQPSIYRRYYHDVGFPEQLHIPPESSDVWFRSVTPHLFKENNPLGIRVWDPIGTYNPQCLPGFNPLAGGGGLETYTIPQARLADGRTLGPTRSLADYITSPPLVLTTLDGAAWLSDPKHFHGQPGQAFISAIRVKVAGVSSPGPVAEARLRRVATAIHDATELQVDIVKGASPRAISIELPAGKFGRPAMNVTEYWFVKGVALRFTRAVSTQNVALLTLVLVGAAILAGQTAFNSVRRRRAEFGTLRALGWPTYRIAWLVELEMLLLGLGVGLVALLVEVLLGLLPGWGLVSRQALWIVPLAVAVAGVAAVLPAFAAARGTTVSAMGGYGRIRRSRPPRSVLTLGVRELMGTWRIETLLGVGAVALGTALLGAVVLVAIAFHGQLDATILGASLEGEVRPFHIVLALLTLLVGSLAAGGIVTLSYLERQIHLATLRAVGWSQARILSLLSIQALMLGLLGGATGALLLEMTGLLLGAPLKTLPFAIGIGLLVAFVVTAFAAAGPLLLAYRAQPAEVLRDE
jgi:putative ABC transport system permease protein